MMHPGRFVIPLAALILAAAPAVAAPSFEVALEAPATAAVGDVIPLVVTVTHTGDEAVVVKEPALDYRSIDFRIAFGDRKGVLTRFTPSSLQPSTLKGEDLAPGKSITLRHEVDAIAAGTWTFQPVFHGAGDDVEGEARTIRVEAKDGAEELLVRIETGKGTIMTELWPEVAPATALHIAGLARAGFYDGLIFHRVIEGFMIQGGCPKGEGIGGPGYSVPAEFNDRKHVAGVWSMARNGDPYERTGQAPRPQFANSGGSQFFLCDAAAPYLNGGYTAFGKVVAGLDVVHAIAVAPKNAQDRPTDPVSMTKVTLVPKPRS